MLNADSGAVVAEFFFDFVAGGGRLGPCMERETVVSLISVAFDQGEFDPVRGVIIEHHKRFEFIFGLGCTTSSSTSE